MRKSEVSFSGFNLSHKKATNVASYSFDTLTNPLKQMYFITCCNNMYELSDELQPQDQNCLKLHKRQEDDTKTETVAPL